MHAMTTLAFDTHAAVKALKKVGFEEAQAEAVVTTVGDAMTGNVATKADVTELRTATEHDIAELRTEMAEQFSILYRHLRIMAIGIVGFTAGLTVALVQLGRVHTNGLDMVSIKDGTDRSAIRTHCAVAAGTGSCTSGATKSSGCSGG